MRWIGSWKDLRPPRLEPDFRCMEGMSPPSVNPERGMFNRQDLKNLWKEEAGLRSESRFGRATYRPLDFPGFHSSNSIGFRPSCLTKPILST